MVMPFVDVTGQRFGKFVAVEWERRGKDNAIFWRCICDCGNEDYWIRSNLLRRHTPTACSKCKQVWSWKDDQERLYGKTPAIRSWRAMHTRCKCVSFPSYKDYGARGITIDPRWSDFRAFLADMGPRPPGTTLDRIDNDGNYEPGNCRWVNRRVQNNNTSRNRHVIWEGTKFTVGELATILKVSYMPLYSRLRRNQWDVWEALRGF